LLVRDPRDVVVSFYHHKKWREKSWEGSVGEFVRHAFDGLPTIVSYYNIWAANRDLPSAFAVYRYEDLVTDTVGTLDKIARFAGLGDIPADVREAVANEYEFDNMQAMEARGGLGRGHRTRPADLQNTNSYKTRSGRIGGYKLELSDEDRAFVDSYVENNLDPYFESYLNRGC